MEGIVTLKDFIENEEVQEVQKDFYLEAKSLKKENRAVDVMGRELCKDIGIRLYWKIILLVDEEYCLGESYETRGCLSFLFTYQEKYYKYLYQW